MRIGIPSEVKSNEYRVALRPVGAELLTQDGHEVFLQKGAGRGSGFEDQEYVQAGATIVEDADAVFAKADLIVKVKEPQSQEIKRLRRGQTLFCYFHFAADRKLTEECLKSGITAVAYETLVDRAGGLPLLKPMSEVAGKMSIQEGAKYLEKPMMGRGLLLGGVPGVEPADVVILGAGIVGANAAGVAAGLGARVTLMDINLDRLRYLSEVMPANVTTVYCDPYAVRDNVRGADLVIGGVLIPGGRAPTLVSAELIKQMKSGAVIVDVCIDQGGCVETARPTTHAEPTYVIDDVVHYCVTNIPGAVGRTSTQALCNATLPYVRELAKLGAERFGKVDAGHASSLNMKDGKMTNPAIAAVFPDLPKA